MNYAELVQRDVADLRQLAAQYGIKTHHKAKADTIAKAIVEHVTPKPVEVPKHPAELPKPPLRIHTAEDVLQAIEKFTKLDGFVAKFPGDDTWYFARKGAEDSGHMSANLRDIFMKAESVSKGARKPFIVKNSDGADVMMAGI